METLNTALCSYGLSGKFFILFADIQITKLRSQVDDYFELILYYDKLRVKLKTGFLVREPAPAYIRHGTKGSLLKSTADAQEEYLVAGIKPNTLD